MPRPAPVSISLTITTARVLTFDAAEPLRQELTEAARWYGITENPIHPGYALSRGAVLFGRDYDRDTKLQTIRWALENLDAAAVRRVAGSLVKTWANIVAVHCGSDAVIEAGGALALNTPNNFKREAA